MSSFFVFVGCSLTLENIAPEVTAIMASRLMHLIIGHQIAERLHIEDRTSFLLGSIAPDAVQTKDESHFMIVPTSLSSVIIRTMNSRGNFTLKLDFKKLALHLGGRCWRITILKNAPSNPGFSIRDIFHRRTASGRSLSVEFTYAIGQKWLVGRYVDM